MLIRGGEEDTVDLVVTGHWLSRKQPFLAADGWRPRSPNAPASKADRWWEGAGRYLNYHALKVIKGFPLVKIVEYGDPTNSNINQALAATLTNN